MITSTPNHDLVSDFDPVKDPTTETQMSWSDITEGEVENNPIEYTWDQSIDELEEEMLTNLSELYLVVYQHAQCLCGSYITLPYPACYNRM